MGFFNKKMSNVDEDDFFVDKETDEEDDGYINTLDNRLDVNKKNAEQYYSLMESSRAHNDDYFDSNNIITKIFLAILFGVGFVGAVYYLILYFMG